MGYFNNISEWVSQIGRILTTTQALGGDTDDAPVNLPFFGLIKRTNYLKDTQDEHLAKDINDGHAGPLDVLAMIAEKAITGILLADNLLETRHFLSRQIEKEHIKEGELTDDEIASDSITGSDKLIDKSVSVRKLEVFMGYGFALGSAATIISDRTKFGHFDNPEVAHIGTGIYTVTYDVNLAAVWDHRPIVIVNEARTVQPALKLRASVADAGSDPGKDAFTVYLTDENGAAADGDFSFIVMGTITL